MSVGTVETTYEFPDEGAPQKGCFCCPSAQARSNFYAGVNRRRKKIFGKKPPKDDGAEVMNAMANEMWPSMVSFSLFRWPCCTPQPPCRFHGKLALVLQLTVPFFLQSTAMLETMKKKTFPMRPYQMNITSGVTGNCPRISNVELLKSVEGEPVEYHCNVHYSSRPELKFKMRGASGNFVSNFLPTVKMSLKAVDFKAKIHVTASVKEKWVSVYFVEPPDLEWDMEVDVGQLDIPLHVEDMMDRRLEKEFAKINKQHPHVVRLAAQVQVTQATTSAAFQGQYMTKKEIKQKKKTGAIKETTTKITIGEFKGEEAKPHKRKSSFMSFAQDPTKRRSWTGATTSRAGAAAKPKVQAAANGEPLPEPKKKSWFGGWGSSKAKAEDKVPLTQKEDEEETKEEPRPLARK